MSEILELLERYRRGAELLAIATTGAAGPELDYKPAEGAWCVRQIVCHLADIEAGCVVRFRQVIAEDEPFMPGLLGKQWAERLDYSQRKLTPVLEVFRVLRAYNHELLKSLPSEAFARTGNHGEMGRVSLLDLLRTYVDHVESHVGQIQRTRGAYREMRAQEKAKLAAAQAAEPTA